MPKLALATLTWVLWPFAAIAAAIACRTLFEALHDLLAPSNRTAITVQHTDPEPRLVRVYVAGGVQRLPAPDEDTVIHGDGSERAWSWR